MTSEQQRGWGYLIDLTDGSALADPLAELRSLNGKNADGWGNFWLIVVEKDDFPDWGGEAPSVWLNAGTAGSHGALQWVERDEVYIPASGERHLHEPAHFLPYFDWSGTQCGVHVALQVPIDQVLAAAAEVVETRRRPTCVEWIAVDRRLNLVGGMPGTGDEDEHDGFRAVHRTGP